MTVPLYLKRYQRQGLYHYAQVWPDRQPPWSEVVNFLHPIPRIEHREYHLELAGDQLDLQALFEAWEWIEEAEFKRAFERATAGRFQVYIDGKPI